MTSSYALLIATASLAAEYTVQRFGHSFKCKVAACSHHPRATNYRVVS